MRWWRIAATVLLAVDAVQTVRMQRQGYHELNPLLGRHPSTALVAGYFGAVAATTWLVNDRRVAIGVTVVEGVTVTRNLLIGIRF